MKKKTKKTEKHKVWIILGIALAILVIGSIFLFSYTPAREALFGQAIRLPASSAPDSQHCAYLCRSICSRDSNCFNKCVKDCREDLETG